jgi:2Fe-2S ferredoxin
VPKITFLPANKAFEVEFGTTVLEAAMEHNLALEHACDASLACATCQVYVIGGDADLESISEEEEDLLDSAWEVKETSRLGCQVVITDDIVVEIPARTCNDVAERENSAAS